MRNFLLNKADGFFISSSTQKRNGSISDLETYFYKILNKTFLGKQRKMYGLNLKLNYLRKIRVLKLSNNSQN